jgi:Ser-tRNA(Ala) deacylase AlaX
MSETNPVLDIEKPHFTIRLYANMIRIDVKDTVKNEIEEALENKPLLRETIGHILSVFVPLHIRLCHIGSVNMDKTGKVKINVTHHRDVTIPLETKEAETLVEKLNQLIPEAKRKELERIMREEKLQKIAEEKLEMGRASAPFVLQSPATESPKLEEELEEAEEKEGQRKED